MPFYKIPQIGQSVHWQSTGPQTLLRFGSEGALVLLHLTREPALTPQRWHEDACQLGLFGVDLNPDRKPDAAEVPPVLCMRLGTWPAVAAPACLVELNDQEAMMRWLNARTIPPNLRLILLRADPEQHGVAIVEASRRVWVSGWAEGDERLRLRLEKQCLDTLEGDEGQVQYAGRKLVTTTSADELLKKAEYKFLMQPESPGELFAGARHAPVITAS